MEQIIKDCISYIESNIEDNLRVDLIANKFGYSQYHFSRLFKANVGETLQSYIIERKLINAARDIIGGSNILDVAVKYQYDTHNGFSKAFKRAFGYSPYLLKAIKVTGSIFRFEGGKTMSHVDLFNELIEELKDRINGDERQAVTEAYHFAVDAHEGKTRYSGDAYVTHPLNVGLILAKMEVPIDTIVFGILHDCISVDSRTTREQFEDKFGDAITRKVARFNELNGSVDLVIDSDLDEEEEILLVRLADRLHNMQTLKYLDESRWKVKAKQTLSTYSPLAERLNIPELKAELDRLSISVME